MKRIQHSGSICLARDICSARYHCRRSPCDKRNNAAYLAPFPSNSAVVSANRIPSSRMIRANLIKSFQAREGEEKSIPASVSPMLLAALGERDVFSRWNTAEERKGLYTSKRVVRPLSCCRWLNFARIPRTKIAIRAGATSEFFMPTRAEAERSKRTATPLAQPCIFYIHSIFAFPSHPDLSSTSFYPSTTFRFPFPLTSAFLSALAPPRIFSS